MLASCEFGLCHHQIFGSFFQTVGQYLFFYSALWEAATTSSVCHYTSILRNNSDGWAFGSFGNGSFRFLLVDALEQGEYTPLIQQSGSVSKDIDDSEDSPAELVELSDQSVGERLLAICNAEVADMSVAAEDNLFELGISSLTLAQIHAAIEDAWPDQVDITDLFDYPTVRELAEFLDNKM